MPGGRLRGRRWRGGWREGVLFALVAFVLSFSWMMSDVSAPNERTRAFLTMAMVDGGTFSVDGPVRRFGPVFDLAENGGHFFTDKAPGSSFVAAPVYAAARALGRVSPTDIGAVLNLLRTWVMIPCGLLGFLAMRALLRRLHVSPSVVDVASVGYALGTGALHYSAAVYGHAMVSTFALLALLAWAETGVFTWAPRRRSLFGHTALALAAGAAAGLSGLIEYQQTVVAALLGLPALYLPSGARWRAMLAFAAGALPFALALLLYNRAAFGSPFSLSYQHLVGSTLQQLHGAGLAGATRPTWEAFWGLTLGASRGLVTTSPLLAFGVAGLVWPRVMKASLRLPLLLACVYFVLIVASSSVWFGGWSFGARLLVPIVGLLVVAGALLVDRAPALVRMAAASAALVGIAEHVLMQATFPEPPPDEPFPLRNIGWSMLKRGLVAPNLVCKQVPLARANLVPLGIALGLIALLFAGATMVVVRRAALRGVVGLATLIAPVLGFTALIRMQEPPSPLEEDAWLRYAEARVAHETGCVLPPRRFVVPPYHPPRAPR